jgi:hypothetical protein
MGEGEMDAEMVARVAKLERMEFLASKVMVVHPVYVNVDIAT